MSAYNLNDNLYQWLSLNRGKPALHHVKPLFATGITHNTQVPTVVCSIDHLAGGGLAYVFGSRADEVFVEL